MNTFFRLDSPESDKKWAGWDSQVDEEQIVCPADPGHMRGGKRTVPLGVVLQSRKVEDMVWTLLGECLVQRRVLRLFRKHRITGWRVRRARAAFRNGNGVPPPLWELIVTGWGGMAPRRSGIRRKYWCRHCGHVVYASRRKVEVSHLIDLKKWDGSDLFIVWPLPRHILATARLIGLLRANRVTGWTAEPVEHLKLGKDFTPGKLSHYLPLERARRLAESPEMI